MTDEMAETKLPEQPKKTDWRRWVWDVIMIFAIVAMILLTFSVAQMSKSCEISSIEQYINRGGRIVANSSGLYDYGQTSVNFTSIYNTSEVGK
jgi:hypothetical protein